jgi:hypothetical protein
LDDCLFVIFANKSLSEKIAKIHVFGNEYKLLEIERINLRIDTDFKGFNPQLLFSDAELGDGWVRIMAGMGPFQLRFSSTTPLRLFEPNRVVDSTIKNRSAYAR